MKNSLLLSILFWSTFGYSQTEIKTLKGITSDVFIGDYNAEDYAAINIIDNPKLIIADLNNEVSPDSLKKYLVELQKFENRNTGSDTLSDVRGIGAARSWIYSKFEDFSSRNDNRLIVDYLKFNRNVCGMSQHKNVLAVLPGREPDAGMVIIEGHMDSRCEDVCDIDCLAEGMEDNGSGTALVIELARVMSKYTFNRTIVFMTTTGEEQGLIGADAMAKYMKSLGADIKAILNNDVIGGIYCGETSSPPSCPGLDHVDSTQVRLFSFGGSKSIHKALARYCSFQYNEELRDLTSVPMKLTIMSAEDRTGRGGDHIPFREQGYPSIRFTSANEHGDAGIDDEYHDRQHTKRDILGIDTNNDGSLDSFYVDFNYLARNTVINGLTAAMISASPEPPTVSIVQSGLGIKVSIDDPYDYFHYKVCLRTIYNTFDTILVVKDTKEVTIPIQGDELFAFVSAMSVDENEVESCLSNEESLIISATQEVVKEKSIVLMQNRPNPFDEATIITWLVKGMMMYDNAYIVINTLDGQQLIRAEVELNEGINEWLFTYGYLYEGICTYSIEVDGLIVDTKTMVFAY